MAMSSDYLEEERAFAVQISEFVEEQAVRLEQEASASRRIKAEFL